MTRLRRTLASLGRNQLDRPARNLPSFPAWIAKYLSSWFTHAPSPFHRWLADELDGLTRNRGQRLDVLAPRGSAKSTLSTFAYPLYLAVHGAEPYIVLTSDTSAQAYKYLEAIRAELEDNDLLARDYPHVFGKGPTWRDDRLKLRNGVVIEALSTGMKLRGRRNRRHRVSLAVVDDPQNTKHILSPLQRERSWEWLTKDVCNAGGPDTNVVVLGTALHEECIVCKLQKTPGWRSRKFQSVISWPDRMDLWGKWELAFADFDLTPEDAAVKAREYYEANRAEMDRGAEVLWPERFPLYDLMVKRLADGQAAFASEQQNDPVNPDACEWPKEYFEREGFWFDQWPEGLEVKTMALDPSKGVGSKKSDYSAIVMLGRDRQGILYVEADLARNRSIEQMVSDSIDWLREFNPDGFAVETNDWQQMLVAVFQSECRKRGVELPIHPIVNTVNKGVRIRRLGPDLHLGRIRFKSRSPGTSLLVEQLRQFPTGTHDDGPDCLEGCKRLAVEIHNGRQQRTNQVKRLVPTR